MRIKWTEKDEFGADVIKEHPFVNERNAYSYAKHNKYGQGSCPHCFGRGYEEFDSGTKDCRVLRAGRVYIEQCRKDVRLEMCSCVLRTLEKMEDAKGRS